MKTPLRHLIHYIVLCVILAIIISLLIYANGNPKIQKFLIVLAGSFYIVWGYIHHKTEKTLDIGIVLEYVLYGFLGSILVIGLL